MLLCDHEALHPVVLYEMLGQDRTKYDMAWHVICHTKISQSPRGVGAEQWNSASHDNRLPLRSWFPPTCITEVQPRVKTKNTVAPNYRAKYIEVTGLP